MYNCVKYMHAYIYVFIRMYLNWSGEIMIIAAATKPFIGVRYHPDASEGVACKVSNRIQQF